MSNNTTWIRTIQTIDRINDDNDEFSVYGKDITIAEAKKIIRHFAKMKEFKMYLSALRIMDK